MSENAEHNLKEIMAFWKSSARVYADVDMLDVKERIDAGYIKFRKFAASHLTSIIENSKELRIAGRTVEEKKLRNKCPFCYGGLYYNKRSREGFGRVRCTHCHMSVAVDTERMRLIA